MIEFPMGLSLKMPAKLPKLLIAVLLLDLSMVVLHLIFGRDHLFFHLDSEQNFPTVYQGAKLIIASTLVFTHLYVVYLLGTRKFDLRSSLIWLPFYVMFLFLGIDELSQFHESFTDKVVNMGVEPIEEYVSLFDRLFDFSSATWLLIYIPVFLIFITYVFVLARLLLRERRREIIYLAIGALLFLCVPVLEYINTSESFFGTDRYENLMILEETSEMFGATFLLYFNWLMLRRRSLGQ